MKHNRVPVAAAPAGRSKGAIRSGTVPSALLGVPLWLCALGILAVLQNRQLRKRYGDIAVRVLRPGRKRGTRGHAIWVSDVFAWRGSPAAWKEDLLQVSGAALRAADAEERKKLHRLGDDPGVATLVLAEGRSLEVAAALGQRLALLGPFMAVTGRVGLAPWLPAGFDGRGR